MWTILFRSKAEPFDHFAVKDPTIVFANGKYHMFYTGANASGGWQMLYSTEMLPLRRISSSGPMWLPHRSFR